MAARPSFSTNGQAYWVSASSARVDLARAGAAPELGDELHDL
jgi:hypothetical protein